MASRSEVRCSEWPAVDGNGGAQDQMTSVNGEGRVRLYRVSHN